MSKIRVTRYYSPREFLQATEKDLERREWQNNIPIGIWRTFASQETVDPTPFTNISFKGILLATWEDSSLRLVGVKSPDYPALGIWAAVEPSTIDIPTHTDALVKHLVSTNADDASLPINFNGDPRICLPVTEQIAALLGDRKVKNIGEIRGAVVTRDTFTGPPNSLPDGHATLQINLRDDETHLQHFATMTVDLLAEAAPDRPVSSTSVQDALLYETDLGGTWGYTIAENTLPVAMVVAGRETATGMSIHRVFVQKEHRGRGYGEALVRKVVEYFLERKDYVSLFFQDHTTASRLYRRVGFGGQPGDEIAHGDYKLVPLTES